MRIPLSAATVIPDLIGVKTENYVYFFIPSRNSFKNPSWAQEGFFMPIYTKKGDKGKTSLFSGKRIWKDDVRTESYGTIDELSSFMGASISFLKNIKLKKELFKIQNTLFYVGSYLAGNKDVLKQVNLENQTKDLEAQIDFMTKKMPKLSNFILPGGGEAGSLLQVARTVARRSERDIVKLSRKEKIDENLLIYINRLSDYLFTVSRFINFLDKKKEIVWEK